MNYRFFSLSDNSLTVEFDNKIFVETNNRILRLAHFIDRKQFTGLIETVPAYSSLTIFYDVTKVRKSFPNFETAFEAISSFAKNALKNLTEIEELSCRETEIPICFDLEFALDLEFIAAQKNLSTEEIIEIFLSKTYRVFMLGFLPGFAYMGEIDERIAVPRKQNPRLKIPAGSIGIAGKQTGIYPLESPGGWQIIGKTPLQLFTPDAPNPTLLKVGDTIKFVEIERKAFDKLESFK